MFVKKLFTIALPILFLVTFKGHAQVITTKKEAVKSGKYKKPATSQENLSPDVKSALTAFGPDKNEKIAANSKTPSSQKKSHQKTAKNKRSIIKDTEEKDLIPSPDENYIAVQMINNAMTFIGTRYLGGGTSLSGMDCSGMVTAVFNIFDIKIPRSSNEMAKVGQKVANDDIKKGDLIFFHTNGKRIINHVGMVVEVLEDEIKFVHSSTQKGVIVSSTKEPYYKKNFVQANRML